MTRSLIPLIALLAAAAALRAQDDEKGALDFLATPRYVQLDVGTGLLYLVGDVEVTIDGRYLRCDNLVAWLDLERKPVDPNAPPPERIDKARQYVKEVYAEGNVVYSKEGEWVHGDRLFIDLRRERGLVIDATMSVPVASADGEVPLVVRAAELRILGRDRVQGSGIQAWIGPFGRPFTNLTSDDVEIIADQGGLFGDRSLNPGREPNYHVSADGNVLRLGTLPVLWLPDFEADTARHRSVFLIQSVRFDNSNEFGTELGVSLGSDITYGEDRKRWGKWQTHLDWYSKRGPGVGVDITYGMPTYRGELFARYQRDHGDDENFGPPPTKNRGRLSWWHRQFLPEGVQMDVEFQLFSDRGYYPTWHEDDFKGLKPPENLVYLKKTFFNSMLSGLYSQRINDWLTRVEHEPELRYDLVTDPLFDIGNHPLYLTVSARGGRAEIQFDERLRLGTPDSWRVDVDTLLEYALPVGPLKVTPFAGLRYTYYESDVFGNDDRDRLGFTHGATVSAQAWRTFQASGGIFNLDGLRHVVIPEITFRNTVGVDLPPSSLIPFDEVETFDNVQVFELRLRNLLQTMRHRPHGTDVDTFVDLEVEVPFYPNPRDNPNAGTGRGEPWGNLDVDLLVRFSDELQLLTDFEIDWYGRDFEVANAAIGYTPGRELQVYAGFRHFHDQYDAVFAQANWRVDEKWMLTAESSYDLLRSRGIDHRLIVSRIGPEWVFQFGIKADLGEDDFGVFVSLEPRFLFDPILRSGVLQSEPRLHYLGSGLGK